MRRLLVIIALALALAGVFVVARTAFLHQSARRAGVQMGLERYARPQPAPQLSFLDETGARRDLSEWRGQATVLNLWGTWCPPCRREMPSLDRLQVYFRNKPIRVITVHLDRPGSTAPAVWLRKAGLSHLPAFHDDSQALLRAVHSRVAPTTLILDASGRELARVRGGANWDDERLRTLLLWAARQK